MINDSQYKRLRKDPYLGPIKAWTIFNRYVLNKGESVLEKDWDNLIILDACRYDLFEEMNTIEGELSKIKSAGSHTAEFLQKNFTDEYYGDTIYVTGTPQVKRHGIDSFVHDCIHVWEREWNEELQTVLPETMVEKSLQSHNRHPEKRLIAHFIQPHYPFIGPTGQSIQHRTITGGGLTSEDSSASIWDRLEQGEVESELVQKAYRENLELTLPYVETLVDELVGKTVITADHGNVFGKYGIYGHPAGKYLNGLVDVPWLVTNTSERRNIKNEPKKEDLTEQESLTSVNDRLSALGYK